VTTDHYTNSKPHPEPYQTAIETAVTQASKCVAVEDSERGLRSALAAGLRCYAVPRGLSAQSAFDGAVRVAASLKDVCDEILARAATA
jgi:beta-phosphoglucomutase-like phosphatase (HAD superfamily)